METRKTLATVYQMANAKAFLEGNGATIVKCEEKERMNHPYIEISYLSKEEIMMPHHYRSGGSR